MRDWLLRPGGDSRCRRAGTDIFSASRRVLPKAATAPSRRRTRRGTARLNHTMSPRIVSVFKYLQPPLPRGGRAGADGAPPAAGRVSATHDRFARVKAFPSACDGALRGADRLIASHP